MADREKVIKSVDICRGNGHCEDCQYYQGHAGYTIMDCRKYLLNDVHELLKEQEAWINEIAEYQQSISGSGMHELDDYEKGKWDGLQIAWNIISEGR